MLYIATADVRTGHAYNTKVVPTKVGVRFTTGEFRDPREVSDIRDALFVEVTSDVSYDDARVEAKKIVQAYRAGNPLDRWVPGTSVTLAVAEIGHFVAHNLDVITKFEIAVRGPSLLVTLFHEPTLPPDPLSRDHEQFHTAFVLDPEDFQNCVFAFLEPALLALKHEIGIED